ncbi:MAG: undecaprenyl/decaprenyl-phosphate alpha-N-acetylglucosaminyl 1-phosphate transferase [Prevotella sp.]|nr:undecaprenyl/decaprenyl-phosphate alpha-N-acetylglucosaminyl 1-phosphate transferase [Prevotella sp.]MDY4039925.1 MraY family glycosyltransferase [Prevotella sp.]
MNLQIWFFGIILPFLSAMLLTFWIHPRIVRIAKIKNIVDNPNSRKLQRRAVPVMGGFAVFFGIVVGVGLTSVFFDSYALFTCVVAMTVMMYFGFTDDILGLSPWLRIIVEIIMVGFVIKMDMVNMNDMHGLFGIHKLPVWLSLPLSAVAGVGIINSINMIDGVDGLSSGFCVVACLSFGFFFCVSYDGTMAVMCALAAGALIPFFLHNVFGAKSKMFIGDCGTMMMGMLMTIFCLHVIDNTSRVAYNFPNMGVVAFCLSVLSVPIFDTLRVMTTRILRGVSPFHADKHHLHHLFIEIGFSHAGTAMAVISLNVFNLFLWLLTYRMGGDATVQFLVVSFVGIFNTSGIYWIVRRLNHDHLFYRTLKRVAEMSHVEAGKVFLSIRAMIDSI